MIFADVILSLPVLKYTTDVTLFAPRKSTQIEWLILEVLKKLQENRNSNYNNYSVDFLFSHIFKIPDSDNLLKPCFFDLISLGAIENNSDLSDDTKLKDYWMKDLSITDVGLEMQKKGLLPGEDRTQVVDFFYNVSKKQIQIDYGKKKYEEEACGVQIGDTLENLIKTPMPEIIMKDYLYQLKFQTNSCPDWLKPETEIKGIEISHNEKKPKVYWDNRKISLEIKNNMKVSLQNYDGDPLFVNQIIQYLVDTVDTNLKLQNLKDINIPDIDIFASRVTSVTDIKNVFNNIIRNSNLFYYNEDILNINEGELIKILNKKICLILSATDFSIKRENGIVIRIPHDKVSISKDCAFGTNKESVYLGMFTVSGYNYTERLPLYFSMVKQKENLDNLINQILSNYLNDQNIDLIYLLAANNRQEDFLKVLNKVLDAKNSLHEKFSMIDQIVKHVSTYGINIDKNTLYLSQIQSNRDSNSIEDTISLLKEIKDIYIFKKDNDLFFKAINKLLETIPSCNSYDELYELISNLKTSNSISNWLASASSVKKLYSDNVLLDIIKRYETQDFLKLSFLSRFEQSLRNMKRNQNELEKMINKGSFPITLSKDTFKNHLISTRVNLASINECIKKHGDYKRSIDSFLEERMSLSENTLIRSYDDLCSDVNSYFSKVQDTIKVISDIVTKFYDESALNYEKIYVIDTCSIMNHPELLDKFTNNKSALILPKVVIEELNKNKDFSRNKEKSLKAQRAIAELTKYQQNNSEWLLTESSHPECLPPEYPPVVDENNQKWRITDNLILSIALKYKIRNVILITDDKNLFQKAKSEKIICTNTNKFLGINQNKRSKQ